jgi:hypothetical protein
MSKFAVYSIRQQAGGLPSSQDVPIKYNEFIGGEPDLVRNVDGTFTVTTAGVYLIEASILLSPFGVDVSLEARAIAKKKRRTLVKAYDSASHTQEQVQAFAYLSVGESLTIVAAHSQGAAKTPYIDESIISISLLFPSRLPEESRG